MMLIKTSESRQQMENMLKKKAQCGRLAQRQDTNRHTLQVNATAISGVPGVMQVKRLRPIGYCIT